MNFEALFSVILQYLHIYLVAILTGVNCTGVSAITCNSTGQCVNGRAICNGENDCGDWEDEKNCGNLLV
jgi:hypothetical protein